MSDDPTPDHDREPPADPIGLEEETDPPGSEQGEPSGVTFGKDWRHEPPAPQREPANDPLPFDFTLTFQAIAEDLHQHPRTRDVVANLHAPVSDFVIETIEDGLGFPVPSDLLSIYQQTDGLELTWSWVDDAGATRPGGAVHLHSFAHVFGRWLDTLWVEDDAVDPDTLDLIWSLRGFDGRPRRDDAFQRVTAIHIRDDDSPTLYTHHHGVGTHALKVGPIDYLYWCLTARGLPGWQLLASDYDLDADPLGIDPRPALFDTMSTLFPEQDLEVFERLHPAPLSAGEEE
jgi:hypothetical protein